MMKCLLKTENVLSSILLKIPISNTDNACIHGMNLYELFRSSRYIYNTLSCLEAVSLQNKLLIKTDIKIETSLFEKLSSLILLLNNVRILKFKTM